MERDAWRTNGLRVDGGKPRLRGFPDAPDATVSLVEAGNGERFGIAVDGVPEAWCSGTVRRPKSADGVDADCAARRIVWFFG